VVFLFFLTACAKPPEIPIGSDLLKDDSSIVQLSFNHMKTYAYPFEVPHPEAYSKIIIVASGTFHSLVKQRGLRGITFNTDITLDGKKADRVYYERGDVMYYEFSQFGSNNTAVFSWNGLGESKIGRFTVWGIYPK
jgi:hypothetical protein